MTKAKQYAIALYQLSEGKDEKDIQELVRRFLIVVRNNGHKLLLKRILVYFQQIAQKSGDLNYLEIVTARRYQHKDLFPDNDSSIKVEYRIDPSIIGGALIIVNHQYLIDNSIRRKITKLIELSL